MTRMTELPSGTVTLLFSDIEGSTKLLSRLGASYANALDGQRSVLRDAWSTHHGTELGTEGDSFYVVFQTAGDAVLAAAAAQVGMRTHAWPDGEEVRVRMGIHTGSPAVHDGAYVGIDVHRAARIAGAAHGGQVVVSSATASLVGSSLPDGVGLRDLGNHRLKDIDAPERLHQLVIDGIEGEFPPLKSLGAVTSVPTSATPLVGRSGEYAEIAELVADQGIRLVTLTGSGGSGKTRLALELARRLGGDFPDGAYFVPLAEETEAASMWAKISEVLAAPAGARSQQALLAALEHQRALLVLDNLEQLPDAPAVVAELLEGAPGLVVLATSRRPLHLAAEHEHAVPPLELPVADDVTAATRSGAVQLFTQQAERVGSTFVVTDANVADVAAICRRLDGLPLALELAASRTKLLSPRAILARLGDALDIPSRDHRAVARQRTLRETIKWSYDLLAPEEQRLFRRLGVFAGGADLAAVQAVAGTGPGDVLDRVTRLVDASVVVVTETSDGEPRVGLLETVRVFARLELEETGELVDVRDAHARYYLGVAEENAPLLGGMAHVDACTRLGQEHDNFREALEWDLGLDRRVRVHDQEGRLGSRLCIAVNFFWISGGHITEAQEWTQLALDRGAGTDSPEQAKCLQLLAQLLDTRGSSLDALVPAEASVAMWRRLGDQGAGMVKALRTLGRINESLGRMDDARTAHDAAVLLARRCDDPALLHDALGNLAVLAALDGDLERSLTLGDEALVAARSIGDTAAVAMYLQNNACSLREMHRLAEAAQVMGEVVLAALPLGNVTFGIALAEDYAALLAELGHHHSSVTLLGAADATRARLGVARLDRQSDEIGQAIALARQALPESEWDECYLMGQGMTVYEALREAHLASTGIPTVP